MSKSDKAKVTMPQPTTCTRFHDLDVLCIAVKKGLLLGGRKIPLTWCTWKPKKKKRSLYKHVAHNIIYMHICTMFVCLFWGALFSRRADQFPNPFAFTLYPYRTFYIWTVWQANALLASYFWLSRILTEPTLCWEMSPCPRSFYCSSTLESERSGICSSIWHFCHTEGATRQCLKTVLLWLSTAAISLRESNHRCCAYCVFQQQEAPWALVGRGGFGDTVFHLWVYVHYCSQKKGLIF